jgi:hypothetical protein
MSAATALKISGYLITGYDIKLYCKKTETDINTPKYKCVVSFGTGMKRFCMTSIYESEKPTELYIDRIEKNNLCVIGQKLNIYDRGTVKLVKTALFVLKTLFPIAEKISLIDDSLIYCEEESKRFKLSMSYDYIIKYNQTWYQKCFNAELPGFISKQKLDENKFPKITSVDNSLMDIYSKSLVVLDQPILNYELMLNRFDAIREYKEEYNTSATPREFINKLRVKLGSTFCYDIGKWLNQYMGLLHIKLLPDFWLILISNISQVPKFSMNKIDDLVAKHILDGDVRNTTKNSSFDKKYLKLISDPVFTESFISNYSEK